MTRAEAVTKLRQGRELYTDMLEPLGIAFESWLRWAQRPDRKALLEKLLAHYERTG